MTNPGGFRKSLKTAFFAKGRVPSAIYEWSARNRGGRAAITVRFSSPLDEQGPRRFFMDFMLRNLFNKQEQSDKVMSRLLSFGKTVLGELESHDDKDSRQYDLALALFRNRNKTPFNIDRKFGDVQDFIKIADGRCEFIVPEIYVEREHDRYRTRRNNAFHLFESASKSAPRLENNCKGHLNPLIEFLQLADLTLCHFQSDVAYPQPNDNEAVDPVLPLPYCHKLDLLMVEGLAIGCTTANLQRIDDTVRSTLIYQSPEIREAEELPSDLSTKLFQSILNAVNQRTPTEFDQRWLKNALGGSFEAQLGLRNIRRTEERRRIKNQARRAYADMVWRAYKEAARCYGAWLLIAYIDFCNSDEIQPTDEEKMLFRQMHYRQAYLAGLPLAFFGRSQVRWIGTKIRELWTGGVMDPKQWENILHPFAVFGKVVGQRRAADRQEKKKQTGHHYEQQKREAAAILDQSKSRGDDPVTEAQRRERNHLPCLISRDCPQCGNRLKIVKQFEQREEHMIVASFWCEVCSSEEEYLCDLRKLASLVGLNLPV